MPTNAEPGGYYGAVLVSTVQDEGSVEIETARSPIVARIGTLLFITVPGKAETSGQLLSLTTNNNQWWWEKDQLNLVSYLKTLVQFTLIRTGKSR
jgi:hypothetical protein